MRLKLETIQEIIVAAIILHNFARDEKEVEPPVEIADIGIHDNLNLPIAPRDNAVRNALIADYFARNNFIFFIYTSL